jgi:uroporphyrinogen decarboxylase
MNNRERVLTSLLHKQPDKVPYQVDFTVKAHEKMVQWFDDKDFHQKIGCCLFGVEAKPKDAWKEISPDIWQDEFGVQWNRSVDKDIGVVCNRVVTPENVNDFPMPDPEMPSRYWNFFDLEKRANGRFIISNRGFSLFERAWTLAGMEEILIGMFADKKFVNTLLDYVLEFNLKLIEKTCSYPIDAMMFGDDWGQQRGLIMGRELWCEFIKPRIKEMYSLVKKKGKFVFIHSCGKVDEIFPDLIECGVDVFNPFQPEVIDVYDAKKKFGNQMSFYGGISTQRTLPYATTQEVKDEVNRLLEKVGKNGGYIAAPAHSIPADAKPENIAATLEVLQNQ